jgi:hypothetical protein
MMWPGIMNHGMDLQANESCDSENPEFSSKDIGKY